MTFSPAIGGKAEELFHIDDAISAALDGTRLTGFTAEVCRELENRHGKGHGGIRIPAEAFSARVKSTGASALVAGAVPLTGFDMDGRTVDIGAGVFGELQAAKLGVRMVSTAEAVFRMPVVDQRPTGAIFDVDEAITDQGGSNFTTVDIQPVVAASMIDVENSLDFARNPNARQLVSQHILQAVQGAMDSAIVGGYTTGTGATWAGLNATATASGLGPLNVTSVISQWRAVQDVLRNYKNSSDVSEAKWVWNPAVTSMLMAAPPFAGANTAMASAQGIGAFCGNPVSEIMLPVAGVATDAYFGDFSQITVAMFNSASIELVANPYEATAFARGATKLRIITSFGVACADPARIIQVGVNV